ncbi:MAG: monovalent cation/H+ antiporter complex subunit F [Fimbriimonadaceae bacterium]
MNPVLSVACDIALVILAVAFVVTGMRIIRGPLLADRVLALDLFAVLTIATIAVFVVKTGNLVFLDAATVLALVAFVGTVAFARYLEKEKPR